MTRIVGRVKGKTRFDLLQYHRLVEFEKSIDALIKGKITPKLVTKRAKKLKELKRGKL